MGFTISQLQEAGMTTVLFPWELDLAIRVGEGRDRENQTKNDRLSYNKDRLMADNRLASIHAAVVEIGVSRLVGAYCYAAVWELADHKKFGDTLPDALRGSIEVEIKWRRNSSRMPVDRKDVEANRLVLWAESKLPKSWGCECCSDITSSENSKVRLLGGGWAKDLWEFGNPYNEKEVKETAQRLGVGTPFIRPIREILGEL